MCSKLFGKQENPWPLQWHLPRNCTVKFIIVWISQVPGCTLPLLQVFGSWFLVPVFLLLPHMHSNHGWTSLPSISLTFLSVLWPQLAQASACPPDTIKSWGLGHFTSQAFHIYHPCLSFVLHKQGDSLQWGWGVLVSVGLELSATPNKACQICSQMAQMTKDGLNWCRRWNVGFEGCSSHFGWIWAFGVLR